MSDAARVLSQLAYLDLFKSQIKTAIDVKGWVANQNYLVVTGMTEKCFTLTTLDSRRLRAALANDCNRMSMAAVESICGVEVDLLFPKSSAWAAIRSYYASFFAAHALLRIYGCAYSQLEPEHIRKILEMANALGINSNIRSGLYSIQIDKTFTTLKFEKQNDSHKDMWRGFLALINQLLLKIDETSSIGIHKINAMDLLEEARKCVTKNGSRVVGNWLSELRNQVNYQHLYGAWFPYDVRAIDERVVKIANTKWTYPSHSFNTTEKQGELERFFESTAFLLSLLREMICICSENVDDEGSVFHNGVLRMLRTIKVM